jgi:tyrosyl-tRNA synthetase
MRLAFEITKIYHGEKKAKRAQKNFIKMFQKKEIPNEMKTVELGEDIMNIIDLLKVTGLVESNSEARRLIAEKAIKKSGEIISDINQEIKIIPEGFILQRGKRQFVKVIKAQLLPVNSNVGLPIENK